MTGIESPGRRDETALGMAMLFWESTRETRIGSKALRGGGDRFEPRYIGENSPITIKYPRIGQNLGMADMREDDIIARDSFCVACEEPFSRIIILLPFF